jgi:hypothetical protein
MMILNVSAISQSSVIIPPHISPPPPPNSTIAPNFLKILISLLLVEETVAEVYKDIEVSTEPERLKKLNGSGNHSTNSLHQQS